jgi:UDP-N-acetylglucosamine:LPS N-acetylglucosamine transferase
MDRIIISGGGTGGHIYPGIAIANELLLLKDDHEIIFVGGKNRLESKIIPRYNFPFIPISVAGFPRRLTWRWLQVIPKVLLGIVDSFRLLKRLKPKVVIGTGGYVCGPMLLAASLLRIPTLIQEQNAVPGLTNRILGRFVDEIHVAFEEAVEYFKVGASVSGSPKVRVTGNPIRREIRLLSEAKTKEARWQGEGQGGKGARGQEAILPSCHLAILPFPLYAKFGLESGKKTVFVMGGSQGAHPINAAMIEALLDCRLSIVDCRLKRQTIINHQSRWLSWLKDEYDDSEVIEAVHKHETEPRGWHTFTPEQIAAALEVSKLLVNHYNLRDVVGHDDIAPGRKLDPGPAFPMESFRACLFEGLEC